MTQKQKQPSSRRWILWVLAAAFAGGVFFGWKYVQAVFLPEVPSTLANQYVTIPTGSSFDEVVAILKMGGFIRDEAGFRWLAGEMNYRKEKMRAGRFEIKPGWTTRQLIQHLRNGEQAPVKVVLNSERLPEEVAATVSQFIEADSLALISAFRDPAMLASTGYTPETVMAAFIPNTYEMFWNTDAKGFLDRMLQENKAFWDKNDRRAKAKAQGLTETQAYTLASIVERETNHNPEKPNIAGVYLNRLKINMRLQADPTSVFATRDFATRRVTEYHTTFDSPYNTYVYKGLPPGPISMASIPSLDAVLNPARHDYLYFCAKPDDSGTHAFAVTFEAHKVNAERFQRWVATQQR
ncbi:MAG TPA: endolytic transglycosylase MltG [Saprospiraceae bacterium]|nr:endolytic transglycosylase MltG [Saprospiraceae bacterium]